MTPVNDQPGLFDLGGEPDRDRPLFPAQRRGATEGTSSRGSARGAPPRPAGEAAADRTPAGRRARAGAGTSVDELEELARRLEESGRYRVLRRFEERVDGPPEPQEAAGLRKGVYLDVETTGRSASDRIIELALLEFRYDEAGRVARVSRVFDAFEDPGRAIPAEIVALTGITDDMVRGHRIDDGEVTGLVADADIVVAHNAAFDRPFAEARFPVFRDLAWACSVNDVDWAAGGFGSRKLENLAIAKGFFYQAHRAIYDCHVGVRLLGDALFDGGPTALADLLGRSSRETVRLWAEGSPFDKKDDLKARYYRWNSQAKVWWCDVPAERHQEELEWLAAHVYSRRPPLPFLRVDARLRYSPRLPEAPPPGCERL